MKRLSRHTVVVLLIALLTSLGGMSLAVVAFGQSSGGNPDATVPLGDYTGTTTTPSPAPTSSYTTTVNTTATTITPTTTTQTQEQSGQGSSPSSTSGGGGSKPTTSSGSVPNGSGSAPLPSRVTRSGPTHLAFTGGEPLIVGALGLALMAGGLVLQARRRRGLR